MSFVELQATTNFSFLRGASHPEELIAQADAYGYKSVAITDRNTLAGVVRAFSASRKSGVRLIVGARIDLIDGPPLLAYPTDLEAYSRLSNLLSLGNFRTEKGKCDLYKRDVYEHARGMKFIAIPPDKLNNVFDFPDTFKQTLGEYKDAFGENLFIAATRRYNGADGKHLHTTLELSKYFGVPMVATNDVHYHHPDRRELQDILTCVREKKKISNAGFLLYPNAERYLKPIDEMQRLFRQYPQAIEQTQIIASACQFSLDQLTYRYPKEVTSEGRTPQEEITYLAWKGAQEIFQGHIPDKITYNINYELRFIEEMNYAEYFLTVYDIVREARSRKILCQGRGSAANSTICYCLGITSVDPSKFDLLFERFISSARNEPPDIDVDFEHERREEIMQYIFHKYGRDRAAIVATVTQLHHKGAINDVGSAMGLSIDTVNALKGLVWDFEEEGFDRKRLQSQGINPDDKTVRKVLQLTGQLMGFPRQLGQHTGGFVITQGKLTDLCPVFNARMENRTNIEWNKDDIDILKFMKIDVLSLGMLSCIRKGFNLAKEKYTLDLTLANIPQDDPTVYNMVTEADTIGVFQIESRAQQSMLPRLRPKCFYDLVIEVAIVRPGPIQGDMVHPYLRRRNGEEKVEYPSPELKEILERTLGVPLFQEQAMKIAIVAAGFSPAEADELRRAMATFKVHARGKIKYFEDKLIKGMIANGYTPEYSARVFKQLEGFGSYGFPESHAASFALLVYVSSWLKCYYPDVFACAILNSLPMGFYAPAQLVSDAQKHGVDVRPVDINLSDWDHKLEEKAGKYFALRLGFRQVTSLREEDMKLLVSQRGSGLTSVYQLRDIGLSESTLETLANADAFHSIGLDRREALWQMSTKDHQRKALFTSDKLNEPLEKDISLPAMSLTEHVVEDYASTTLSLKAHPISFMRKQLEQLRIVNTSKLAELAHGSYVKVAGLILVRQRPGTAKGVCFITIEDETGTANLVVFPKLFDQYRKEIMKSRLIMVEGKLEKVNGVIHVIVQKCHNFNRLLGKLHATDETISLKKSRSDETSSPFLDKKHSGEGKQANIFPDGRNFR